MMNSIVNEIEGVLDEVALDHWGEEIIENAKRVFLHDGEAQPVLLVMGRNPKSENGSLMHVVPIGMFLRDERSKDLASVLIPKALRAVGAYACARVIESWKYEAKVKEGMSLVDSDKAVMELRATHGGSVENMPGRTEAITVIFETKTKTWVHSIEIERDAKGIGTLGKEDRVVGGEGRMMNWLDDGPTDVESMN